MNNLNGKLPSNKKVKFRYDGDGMRIGKEYISEGINNKTNLIIFHYDLAGNLIMESDKDGSARNIYIYGNGALICKYDYSKTSGSKLSNIYYHWDSKENIVRLTDKSGKQAQSYEYDPYGNIIETKGIVHDNSFRYSSKYYDTETGLYYYGARYYNPEYGIWLSEDPIIANIFNSRDNNPYQFCYNNPNVFTDVWGMYIDEYGSQIFEPDLSFWDSIGAEAGKEVGSELGSEYLQDEMTDWILSYPAEVAKDYGMEVANNLGEDWLKEFVMDRAKTYVLGEIVKGITGVAANVVADSFSDGPNMFEQLDQLCGLAIQAYLDSDFGTAMADAGDELLKNTSAVLDWWEGVYDYYGLEPYVVYFGMNQGAISTTAAHLRTWAYVNSGMEFSFGKNLRVAPLGNRTGHKVGKFSHYHRRIIDPKTGAVIKDGGMKWHRPWEKGF